MNDENNLMLELIFGDKDINEISIFRYIEDVKDINSFCERILSNLEKSGIKIKEDILILTKKKNVWILKK